MPRGGKISPATEWKKGQSGNPAGRPKGVPTRQTIVKRWLTANESFTNPITGKKELLSQADIMTLALLKKARAGDVAAWEKLMDSAFGKVIDKIDHTSEGEKIVPFIFKKPDE